VFSTLFSEFKNLITYKYESIIIWPVSISLNKSSELFQVVSTSSLRMYHTVYSKSENHLYEDFIYYSTDGSYKEVVHQIHP